MVATPAWPPRSLPRLFVDQPLAGGNEMVVDGNYLAAVLRLGPGDQVRLFDDRTGEWLATIAEAGKRKVVLLVGEKLNERETVPDLELLFAPIKRGRIDWLVEKATELGVARLRPVLTRRTIVTRGSSADFQLRAFEESGENILAVSRWIAAATAPSRPKRTPAAA